MTKRKICQSIKNAEKIKMKEKIILKFDDKDKNFI
jgi:hypothetical protein